MLLKDVPWVELKDKDWLQRKARFVHNGFVVMILHRTREDWRLHIWRECDHGLEIVFHHPCIDSAVEVQALLFHYLGGSNG